MHFAMLIKPRCLLLELFRHSSEYPSLPLSSFSSPGNMVIIDSPFSAICINSRAHASAAERNACSNSRRCLDKDVGLSLSDPLRSERLHLSPAACLQ
jgi:hypothetical protein